MGLRDGHGPAPASPSRPFVFNVRETLRHQLGAHYRGPSVLFQSVPHPRAEIFSANFRKVREINGARLLSVIHSCGVSIFI